MTFSPGLAEPKTGTARSRCTTMLSPNMAGRCTSARALTQQRQPSAETDIIHWYNFMAYLFISLLERVYLASSGATGFGRYGCNTTLPQWAGSRRASLGTSETRSVCLSSQYSRAARFVPDGSE